MYKNYISILFILSTVIIITGCLNTNDFGINVESEKYNITFNDIKKRGKLIAVTNYNSTDYFIYKGNPMGFQKEILQDLANSLNLALEIKVNNNLHDCFEGLHDGRYDIIAIGLSPTKERTDTLEFTNPISTTKQVLVQRKPDGWKAMKKRVLDTILVKESFGLANRTVYVEKGSSFKSRLENLSEEIGAYINIIEPEDLSMEELITKVSKGEIEYTVGDEHIASVNKYYYDNLDISTEISLEQKLAWAVRKNEDTLLYEINNWLETYSKSKRYALLYTKYYRNRRSTNRNMEGYFSGVDGEISKYDDIIKAYSTEIDWDWRLLASLIYQESRFKPNSKSWAGAFGLMQLMPNTASRFGIDSLASPNANIQAGVRYIKWLEKQLNHIQDSTEKSKFILASYNVGLGHVLDARRLAEKNGKDPDVWTDNVDFYLLNKSKPQYYLDPVVKYGYCRGSETYKYVTQICNRYNHYKNLVDSIEN